jgi:hypothetical protein
MLPETASQGTALAAIGPAPSADANGFAAANQEVPQIAQVTPLTPSADIMSADGTPAVMVGGIRMVSNPVLGLIYPDKHAPLIAAQKGPTKRAGVASRQQAVAAPEVQSTERKAVKLALADVAPKAEKPSGVKGTHLVQLGAFTSAESAKSAWQKFNNRYSVLSGFSSASSSVVVNGKSYIRLAAMGFDSKQGADAVCNSIKSSGGSCIVRSVGGKQPVKMASAQGRKIASR